MADAVVGRPDSGVGIPVAYLLMQRIGLPGIWYRLAAAFFAGLGLQLVCYYGFWKKQAAESSRASATG